MGDETLRLVVTSAPAAGLLLFAARYVWRIQAVITARFDHVIQALREDIVDLERRNERLELLLTAEREARRADNQRCDQQLSELRGTIALLSPLFGNPPNT